MTFAAVWVVLSAPRHNPGPMCKGFVSEVMQLRGGTYRKLGPIKHPLVMGSMTLKGTMALGLLYFSLPYCKMNICTCPKEQGPI